MREGRSTRSAAESSWSPGATARQLPPPSSFATATGVLFGLIGILGFIPGVTKHINFKAGLRFSGTGSHAELFGLFRTSVMHNGIFLILGILGGVAAFFVITARLYFFFGAVLFLFLAIYGLSINQDSAANFLPVNTADNWLHLAIAVLMLAVGVVLSLPRDT